MKITVSRDRMFWLVISCVVVFVSCEKKDQNPNKGPGSSAKYSMEDSLKFYTWYYSLSDSANIPQYYWNDKVPVIDPFSSSFANADSLLGGQHGISSYSLVNGKKADRYSFLDRTGAVSGEIEGGQLGDKGFDIRWSDDGGGNTSLWVVWAYASSPAGQAGVQRGWQITGVDGNSSVGYDGTGYGDGSGDNVNRVINAIYYNASSKFTFKKPSGRDTTIALATAQYSFNPVLFDTVYTVNSKKVGYFVFNSFVSVYNYDSQGNITGGTPTKTAIDNVFSKFQSAGVKDVIVDLRYNGGGAVSTAEYLDNLLVPAGKSGSLMYSYNFNGPWNNYYQSNNVDLTVNFTKQGSLELDDLFFIVGPDTYSASELTMNNLKPEMNVHLIGSTTGGKPVGFIPQPIYIVNDTTNQEVYAADMYAINFQTKNSAGSGDYFFGIDPDQHVKDFIDLNWGDPQDAGLTEAFTYIETGSFSRTAEARLSMQNRPYNISRMTRRWSRKRFNGMVDYRLNMRTHFFRGVK